MTGLLARRRVCLHWWRRRVLCWSRTRDRNVAGCGPCRRGWARSSEVVWR